MEKNIRSIHGQYINMMLYFPFWIVFEINIHFKIVLEHNHNDHEFCFLYCQFPEYFFDQDPFNLNPFLGYHRFPNNNLFSNQYCFG